jgi:hypothetical protein
MPRRVVTVAAVSVAVVAGIIIGAPAAASDLARAAVTGLGFAPLSPLPGGSLTVTGGGCGADEAVLVRTWIPAIGSASYHDVVVVAAPDGSFSAATDVHGAPGDVPTVAPGDQFGVAVFCGGVPTADPELSDTVFGVLGALNSAPVALSDTFSTAYESVLEVSAPGLLANDSDADGDAVTAHEFTGPAHGTLTNFLEDGSFVYTPDAGFTGTDSFVYYIWDGVAASADVAVTIEVGAAPTATDPDDTLAETGASAPWAVVAAICLLGWGAIVLRRARTSG